MEHGFNRLRYQGACMTHEDKTLEIYKVFVDSSLRLTERRQSMNRFNLTIVSGLAAAAWVIISTDNINPKLGFLIGILAIWIISLIGTSWKCTIRYYRELSSAKFKVIHKMENEFPAKPFTEEWSIVKSDNKNKQCLTNWEEFLPSILQALFWPSMITLLGFLSLCIFKPSVVDRIISYVG